MNVEPFADPDDRNDNVLALQCGGDRSAGKIQEVVCMSETKPNVSQGQQTADFRLLVQRLRTKLVSGQDQETVVRMLGRQDIWSRLDSDLAVKWAGMAVMAGKTDIALSVFEHVHHIQADHVQAWKEHYDLLLGLCRYEQAASLRSRALAHNPWAKKEFPVVRASGLTEPEDAAELGEPFARKQQEEKRLDLYLRLFQGREDCFARQWADKKEGKQGYVPVRRPMTREDVLDHLHMRRTYGIYLLQQSSLVSLGVVDVDLVKALRTGKIASAVRSQVKRERDYLFSRLPEVSQKFGLYPLAEFSGGKGYHFWFFFETPVRAKEVREVLTRLVAGFKGDLSHFHLEVFPKQDSISGNGLGNLVKLPLGAHRVTGKRSYFLPKAGQDMWEELACLESVHMSRVDRAVFQVQADREGQVLVHPRQAQWVKEYPELADLHSKCPALAQIMVQCRQGRSLSQREERILFGTLGFLTRRKAIVHALMQHLPDYNPHLVDYKLSRVRGTVLGCKKIHTLLALDIDYCQFDVNQGYAHPLRHCPQYQIQDGPAEKVDSLQDALEQLRQSMEVVKRFLPEGKER
jgi:hypothetical protein